MPQGHAPPYILDMYILYYILEGAPYSIAPRIPPVRIEGAGPCGVLGVPRGSLHVIGGSLEVAGGVLWLCWVPREMLGRSSGGLWGVLGVPGGSLGCLGGSQGGAWRGPREALGAPRGGPGRIQNT